MCIRLRDFGASLKDVVTWVGTSLQVGGLCEQLRPGVTPAGQEAFLCYAINPRAPACLSSPCCVKGSEAKRGSQEQLGVQSGLHSEALLYLGLPSGFVNRPAVDSGPTPVPHSVLGLPSPPTLLAAFLGGFGFCTHFGINF